MAKVLLVEDSSEIRDIVAAVMKPDHEVVWASTLQQAHSYLSSPTIQFDLVLLDIDLPDGNGLEFLARINRDLENRGIGTIFLTGTNTVMSRVQSFSLGALDYIPKPFDLIEFKVRVNAKLKGRQERVAAQSVIRHGSLQVDLSRQQAFTLTESETPKQLELTPVEFRLLLLFMQNAGEVVERQKILSTVWGAGVQVSSRCVDHHVCGLRKKISASGGKIESIYGVGYRIEV